MLNRTQLVESIAGLIKNGINMDGYNLFECNLFLKELNDFINTETSLSSYYKNRKVVMCDILKPKNFDPSLLEFSEVKTNK